MQWQRLTSCAGLLLAWATVAVWQWREYRHERQLARQTLERQAEDLRNVLVGGIRSHRRLGPFFEDQFQGTLDELVTSEGILTVVISAEDGRPILSAGRTDLLDTASAMVAGEFWEPAGMRLVAPFELVARTVGSYGRGGGPGQGRTIGSYGRGGGPGQGRGARWRFEDADAPGPFAAGGQFTAILLLDRRSVDAQCIRAAWLRSWVVVAGGLVLICVALAWRATVRLTEARGRARVLEAETRHLHELSQAAAGLAHETRNPLSLVRGWTQRLAQSELHSPDAQRQARTVVEECDRVTSRINQFLAFAGPSRPSLEAVDPNQIADELAALLEPDLDAKNLDLSRTGSKPQRTVRADREMLRQALFNLVQNAIQFAPQGGTVEIAVATGEDGSCRIEVADRGPGVDAEAVESLFTPYFTTRSDGTGLGLAIVRRIATAHGWQVGYRPRPGGGSVFWLDRIHG